MPILFYSIGKKKERLLGEGCQENTNPFFNIHITINVIKNIKLNLNRFSNEQEKRKMEIRENGNK